MNKHLQLGVVLTLGLVLAPLSAGAAKLVSERGETEITAPSVAPEQRLRVINDKDPIPVTFEEQPPLVPHKIDEYEVNLAVNKCLDCHSKEQAEQKDSTPVSESHYQGSDGKQLSSLAPRRYFCTQCHVPQADVAPLVENLFQPAKVVTTK